MKRRVKDECLKASLMESLLCVEDGRSSKLTSSGVCAKYTICSAFPSLVNDVTWPVRLSRNKTLAEMDEVYG